MDKKMNFEFELKKEFNKECPDFPDSLQKENVIAMLEEKKIKPFKKKSSTWKKAVAMAACLVIIISGVLVMPDFDYKMKLYDTQKNAGEATSSSGEVTHTPSTNYTPIESGLSVKTLKQPASNDELVNYFINKYKENYLDDALDGAVDLFSGGVKSDSAVNVNDALVEEGFDYAVDNEAAEAPAAPVETTAAAAQTTAVETQITAAPQKNNEDSITAAPVADDIKETAAESAGDGSSYEAFAQTNTQVQNVDEADIIKNDGRYLYIISSGYTEGDTSGYTNKLSIVDTQTMSVASEIKFEENFYVDDFYLNGNILVALGLQREREYDGDSYSYRGYNEKSEAQSKVYDVSDRENPTLVRTVTQDGNRIVSSRMINKVLYTVSTYRVYGSSLSDVKENAVPEVNGESVGCDCIYIYNEDSEQYLVLTAYDTSCADGEVSSLSLLGGGESVYCSQNSLYVSHQNYDNDNGEVITDIYSFSLNGTDVAYKAAGSVKGYTNNQYSFDEHNGILRVATTYYSYQKDIDVSSIYALNSDLELIGKLEDIAFDEQIKSVRFMGDVGYVVTFRNTDPLFTLDLADPTKMAVIGEVKLPGFSAYLHPVGEGLMVGVGYDGTEEDVVWNSVKVSLFDVSDLKNPKEVNNFILKDVYTTAIDNPKAFLYYPEESYIGIPVIHYTQTGNGDILSYKLLKIEGGKISSHLGYTHGASYSDIFRGTYIGNKLYTIDRYTVVEHDISTGEKLRECTVGEKEFYNYYYGETVAAYNSADGEVLTTEGYNPDVVMTAPQTAPQETTTISVNVETTTVAVSGEGTASAAGSGDEVTSEATTIPGTVTEPYAVTEIINEADIGNG